MRKEFLLLFVLPFCFLKTKAENDYPFLLIPASLVKNVNVVKRMEQMEFRITEGNKAIYRRKVAYTILNELGEKWATFVEGYDKLRSIESFEGTLYDAAGKKIKSLKKSDIKDESGNDGSLADDSRYKWHSFFYKVYPYTVEYEVEVKYKGTMFLPTWKPQERPVMSVQQSSLSVLAPSSNPLHYKMYNYPGEPVITDDKSDKRYSWEIKNLAGVKSEFATPSWYKLTTSVFLTTEKFVLDDYDGSNASWKDFGKFVYDLKKERDQLPDELKQKVHELTNGITDINIKITKLYEYLQQNTRYISIQLGVGGWQPFDAKYVGTKKYGDCKALSNFMYSLLKEAGIRSVYTVTYRGDEHDYLITDLPSSQFNHVVLFVPQGKDTTWLECTSQDYTPGYMGGDNANRLAVAVDETGGTIVTTPRYGVKENLQIRNIKAKLSDIGDLDASVSTTYQAVQQDRLHYFINGLTKDKLMEFLRDEIDLPTYDIKSFNYKIVKARLQQVNESLELMAHNYATITGKRLFIVPNLITRTNRRITADTARKNDLELSFEFTDIDTVEMEIPNGYQTEAVPQDVSISDKFGRYSCSVKLVDNKLFYYRSYEHYSGRFPASDYDKLVKFYEAIYKADRNRIVLVKKETELKPF
jgi:Domain of Unknown Function with PDB structure (DUF3857)/Transglutaminase-like superfamily